MKRHRFERRKNVAGITIHTDDENRDFDVESSEEEGMATSIGNVGNDTSVNNTNFQSANQSTRAATLSGSRSDRTNGQPLNDATLKYNINDAIDVTSNDSIDDSIAESSKDGDGNTTKSIGNIGNDASTEPTAGSSHGIMNLVTSSCARTEGTHFVSKLYEWWSSQSLDTIPRSHQKNWNWLSLHIWGVFATEVIAADEMAIEYIGEIVRPNVADLRETEYKAMRIQGSYFFRIGSTIIDATKCGNMARFINNSCNVSIFRKMYIELL